MHVLMLRRDLGLGPPEAGGNPFFAGEEEPSINGQVAAAGAYFGQDVGGIIDRLLGEQLPDERVAEAVALVAAKRDGEGAGRWRPATPARCRSR